MKRLAAILGVTAALAFGCRPVHEPHGAQPDVTCQAIGCTG